MDLDAKMAEIDRQYESLGMQLAQTVPTGDARAYRDAARRHAELGRVLETWHALKKVQSDLKEARSLLADPDPETLQMARELAGEAEEQVEKLTGDLRLLLVPKDLRDERNVIVEIRAGTGGEEAGLFARDLFRMYSRYAEDKGWRVEVLALNETGLGGIKEVIATVQGERVFSALKFESGTHRVQRVPTTEASGRIHTSAVTVAILPEADEVEVNIRPEDLRITVQRSSGPGGQSVNTTDSSVRVTHVPTGMIVVCQDEKSQHKNKAKALQILRARLFEMEERRQRDAISADRRRQVGSGDRSGRIRTYNFPQNRVTDHRIGLTLYRLGEILDGNLDELIEVLTLEEQTRQLAAAQ